LLSAIALGILRLLRGSLQSNGSVKRFPAYDPPEYVSWTPDEAVVRDFSETVTRDPKRSDVVAQLDTGGLLALYRGLLRARLHDIMLKRWVMQGVISKAWLATGEEAATIGPVHALDPEVDVVAPMIRNAGACCEFGMSIADMLRGYLGTADSPSKGRDGHVGSFAHRVVQPISTIGNMPPVADGIALAFQMRQEPGVVVTWIGDGSVNSGPTHEALNFAAVQRLPAIFIIQNNQVALGTEVHVHHLPKDFSELHEAYGTAGWSFDGNNVLDAYAATKLAVDRCRAGMGPVILAAETFRMGGHATHDEREARVVLPDSLFAHWGKRDPIGVYEQYLLGAGADITTADLEAVEAEVTAEVDRGAEEALRSRETTLPTPESAVTGVYAD
jgi:TPP-dependent pyruvate/acetoin dehydrogenase alpha subunit